MARAMSFQPLSFAIFDLCDELVETRNSGGVRCLLDH
jgi:hypothetical protein